MKKIDVTTPIMETAETKMTCGFREDEPKHIHKGVDLVPKSTSEIPAILAFDAGTVIYCGNVSGVNQNTGTAGMGTCVAIEHKNGTVTRYQHLKAGSLKVKKGESVKKGQVLGYYGRPTTGNSTGPHLHFDISLDAKPKCDSISGTFCKKTRYFVDPIPYLTKPVEAAPKQTGMKKTGTVTASALNVRKGPGKSYPVVDVIHRGCSVTIISEKDGFVQVGKDRWCAAEYIKR